MNSLKLNKIVLGTVQFGIDYGVNNSKGKPSFETVKSILDFAFQKGIRVLDTAEVYGNAHDVISRYHLNSDNRFKVISKFHSSAYKNSKNLLIRVEDHVKHFDVTSLYGYLFHDFQEFTRVDKAELKELSNSGLTDQLGVSIYTNEQLEFLLDSEDYINLIQLPFNLLDNHYQRSSIMKRASERGIALHTRSTFLQGLFFKPIYELTEYFDDLVPALLTIRRICEENQLSIQDLALNYSVNKDYINNVLIGVDSKEQLELNIDSLERDITPALYKEIDNLNVTCKEKLNPANWKK